MNDHDDLSITNVIRERREADADARRDADEFYRFVYGDNRSDRQLYLDYCNGDRSPEAEAGFNREISREPRVVFPHKTVEEREAEREEEDRKSSDRLYATLLADPVYQALRRGK